MSMITEQVERLRTLADIAKDIADNSTDTVKTLREAADTIEQLAAKVRAENNESQPCEDAISRQAVNEIINDIRDCISVEGYWAFLERLKKLPPVNPQEPKTDSWSIKDVADTFKKHGLIREQEPKTGHWIPVSERLPEDFGLYLITLENGDVCQCEFNPDFIDEEHENGAFTYYHQYFDGATLGMIDEEEEAVDAIAWMPFEPYEPQESEGEE